MPLIASKISRTATLLLFLGLYPLICGGCAAQKTSLAQTQSLEPIGEFRSLDTYQENLKIEYTEPDEHTALEVREILETILPAAQRWGKISAPTTLIIMPSHEALEEAVNRRGYEWLRAWARFDTIHLQSPRTWKMKKWKKALEELLLHELTHISMYQNVGTKRNWSKVELPLWYREGMASVNSGQGYRRLSRAEIEDRLKAAPELRPLEDGDKIFKEEKDIAYSAGHRAFEWLLEKYGEEWIFTLQSLIKERGYDFEAAFEEALPLKLQEFMSSFFALPEES